ncbi:MAG: ribonuclease P protein component [Candidatus Paceibacterota bacterium]|jgi:ribonuclease P protein component
MLSKKKRLTKKDFQLLLKEGKTFSTSLFSFSFKNSGGPSFAFVTPKGIFKNAVKRNKFRRIGYNVLRSIPILGGSGIFFYKKQALFVGAKEIKEDIVFILEKTHFIK